MTPSAPPEHLRADARRNHERIVAAAAEVFAEQGASAGVAEIARRAGVGPATLFRRFPTKDELLWAVVETRMRAVAESLASAAGKEDPLEALREFMVAGCSLTMRDQMLMELAHDLTQDERMTEVRDELLGYMAQITERGKAAGLIRQEIGPFDLALVMSGISQAVAGLVGEHPEIHRRYVEIALAGLRPDPSGAVLPGEAPSLSAMEQAKRSGKPC